MKFTEIVAPTVKELFVRKIENMILSGELACGDKLPSERELAEQMKISKTIVHSGIVDMARKGFLEVVPRVGVFIGDFAKNGTLEALTSIMQHNGGRLDERNVRSMMEMRYAIEGVALKKVAESRTEKDVDDLKKIVDEAEAEIRKKSPNYNKIGELYFAFHHYVCVLSGNTIAPLIINAFKTPSVTFWANSAKSLPAGESIGRIKLFLKYIEERNADAAIALLEQISTTADKLVM